MERVLLLALAVALGVIGGLLLVMSWGSLGHLFGGYQDSPALTYIAFGSIFFVPGVALLLCAWRLVRRHRGGAAR